MKFKLLLAAGLMFMTFLTSFTPDDPDYSWYCAYITSGGHSGGELTSCDEQFEARDLHTDDTIKWYVNNVYIGSTRNVSTYVNEGDEIKIVINGHDSNYTYEYYDTIVACEN
ncbi:hypothetical protein FBD94_06635 [Pedobacter hiemivivus]|uniref:Uncharacterized protein n=1 Tax=Pedobacter hiemivivus TaxID=2530454 RepID=A0A4R0MLB4_9SPHI|nr:hypothetical protein [Pedobacter hiemivivus]TCC87459.1 hypothetical protein EZ444_22810 [Pedobacter hiemivivus]TKC64013.1 hypothetical protein FBD94_06635 [Pedobacter hiemivivus]